MDFPALKIKEQELLGAYAAQEITLVDAHYQFELAAKQIAP